MGFRYDFIRLIIEVINMITFESISDISLTMLDDKPDLELGCQVGDLIDGLSPTYGMTAGYMGFKTITIKFTYSN